MRRVEARGAVALAPAQALGLWLDTGRWPAFVEGFGHLVQAEPEDPEPYGGAQRPAACLDILICFHNQKHTSAQRD